MSRSINCTLGKYAHLQDDETPEERKDRLKRQADERRRVRKDARERSRTMGGVWADPV